MIKSKILILFALIIVAVSCSNKVKVELQISSDKKPVQLAVGKFSQTAMKSNFQVSTSNPDLIITGEIDSNLVSEEAYTIRQNGKNIDLIGGGATGLVYGLQDVERYLSEGKVEIPNIDEAPHNSFRALKFN